MRMHSALHLMCASISLGVTGGQIGYDKSRLDFNDPDKEIIKEFIQSEVNENNLKKEINNILSGKDIEIKKNYTLLRNLIGSDGVSKRVAKHIVNN